MLVEVGWDVIYDLWAGRNPPPNKRWLQESGTPPSWVVTPRSPTPGALQLELTRLQNCSGPRTLSSETAPGACLATGTGLPPHTWPPPPSQPVSYPIRRQFLFQVLLTPGAFWLGCGRLAPYPPTAQLTAEKLMVVPSTADGFRATICALRSLDDMEGMTFHTFSIPEDRCVRLLSRT
jgi:hypothetical protein